MLDGKRAAGWATRGLNPRGSHTIETCALLGFSQLRMVVPHGRFVTTYRSHLQESSSPLTLEEGTDRLSRNVCTELSFHAT